MQHIKNVKRFLARMKYYSLFTFLALISCTEDPGMNHTKDTFEENQNDTKYVAGLVIDTYEGGVSSSDNSSVLHLLERNENSIKSGTIEKSEASTYSWIMGFEDENGELDTLSIPNGSLEIFGIEDAYPLFKNYVFLKGNITVSKKIPYMKAVTVLDTLPSTSTDHSYSDWNLVDTVGDYFVYYDTVEIVEDFYSDETLYQNAVYKRNDNKWFDLKDDVLFNERTISFKNDPLYINKKEKVFYYVNSSYEIKKVNVNEQGIEVQTMWNTGIFKHYIVAQNKVIVNNGNPFSSYVCINDDGTTFDVKHPNEASLEITVSDKVLFLDSDTAYLMSFGDNGDSVIIENLCHAEENGIYINDYTEYFKHESSNFIFLYCTFQQTVTKFDKKSKTFSFIDLDRFVIEGINAKTIEFKENEYFIYNSKNLFKVDMNSNSQEKDALDFEITEMARNGAKVSFYAKSGNILKRGIIHDIGEYEFLEEVSSENSEIAELQ